MTEDEYLAALKEFNQLFDANSEDEDRMQELVKLLDEYDAEHYPFEQSDEVWRSSGGPIDWPHEDRKE